MITDDLDYFLLDLASTCGISLPMLEIPNLSECVNRLVPDYTRQELIAALVELFDRGDILADAEVPHRRRRYRDLRLNADEIEAGIAGAIRMTYYLTPQGGERWARHACVDWQKWPVEEWSTAQYGQITTPSKELTEFLFEREVRTGTVRGAGRWSEVRLWKATNWHVTVGHRVRYRKTRSGADRLSFLPVPVAGMPRSSGSSTGRSGASAATGGLDGGSNE